MVLTADFVEQVSRSVYEHEMRLSSFRFVVWEALSEDEREDLRHQVRLVLDIVESIKTPKVPGLLGLPPPLPTGLTEGETGDLETDMNPTPELRLLTGN